MRDTESEDGVDARRRRVLPIVALVALVASVGVLVGYVMGDSDDEDAAVTTTTTESTTTTTVVSTTTTAPSTTTTVAPAAPDPGDPCQLGSDRDCIDPDGDGQGTYLLGGGDCMEAFAPESAGLCEDLDGDGRAGYPDSG